MICGNTLPLSWNLYQVCGITYLVYEGAHITLVFGSCNLKISRTGLGLLVAERGLLPLKGQELNQPDVTFKHSSYSEILAARSFSTEKFSLRSRGIRSHTKRTYVLYEIFLHSRSYNSLNLDGINNKGNLHIKVPPLIKIPLTVLFLQVQVSRELVHCALLTIITAARNGTQNMSVSGHYTYTRCHESWQYKRISSVQNFSRLILFSLLFS